MTERAEREPEHPGCVLGITLGLLLAAALTGFAVVNSGRTVDANALLAESFAFEELPFELEIVEAAALPGGVRIVRLAHPDYRVPEPEPEPEREPEPEEPDDDEAKSASADPKDSAEPTKAAAPFVPPPRPEMLAGTPPTEVFLAFFVDPDASVGAFTGRPPGGGDDFGGPPGGGMQGGGMPGGPMMMFGEGAPIVMDNGDLDWGVLRAGFIHERRYEKDFGRDEVRVNLSASGRYCVLYARWPKNHAGSRAKVEELLSALSLRNG